MKTFTTLATLLVLATSLPALASKRTAEHILSDPAAFEGKEVTLDVAFVQPVRWVSPLDEFAFFHALTLDRRANKSGGSILVALPADSSASFAKKYGTNFQGITRSTPLRGTLVAANRGPGRVDLWVLDTTATLLAAIEDKKATFPQRAGNAAPGLPTR